jgi:hypothetical protein
MLPARQIQKGKTQLNGNPPALFFFQAVRINAGQGTNQCGLAVINMSGGSEDDLF